MALTTAARVGTGIWPSGPALVQLDEVERSLVLGLVEEVVGDGTGTLDDLELLQRARMIGCRLPESVRIALRELRHNAPECGHMRISGLPVDALDLPATPQMRDSCERRWTAWSAMLMLAALQLGDVIGYRNEKSGALVHDVVPVPGMEASQSNAGSVELDLHVENAFHRLRPDFVALMCLRPGDEGAATLVSSVREVLERLSEPSQRVLAEPRFRTEAPPSFSGGQQPADSAHAILQGHPLDPTLVYDVNATAATDLDASAALDELRALLVDGVRRVWLPPGDLVLLDNRVVVHGRDAFTPRYDGRDRWLQRAYVRLESRNSTGFRPSLDPVLE